MNIYTDEQAMLSSWFCRRGESILIVYSDVIFLENLIMNFFILYCTAKLTRTVFKYARIASGALIGALYVIVLMYLPENRLLYSLVAKIILSVVIIWTSFKILDFFHLIKILAVFYLSSFLFAGAALAFSGFSSQVGVVSSGRIIYIGDYKWSILMLSALFIFILVKMLKNIYLLKMPGNKMIKSIKIIADSKQIYIDALIDTGNSLIDPFTNYPVIIVEYSAIEQLVPQKFKDLMGSSSENDIIKMCEAVAQTEWVSRFRLIPFNSLGKKDGFLIGFRPDKVSLIKNKKEVETSKVIIGIYTERLSQNNNYNALVGPQFMLGLIS